MKKQNIPEEIFSLITEEEIKMFQELQIKIKELNNKKVLNNLIVDSNNQNLVGNRRPFSNGELFSLFLLFIIISISLICSIFIASFTGKELDTIPIWLVK